MAGRWTSWWTPALAQEAGLQPLGEVHTQTAGGQATGQVALADLRLQGGVNIERLPVTLLPELRSPLLGMDVLAKLHFSQRDGQLHIEANP